jgi:hypothetical protein
MDREAEKGTEEVAKRDARAIDMSKSLAILMQLPNVHRMPSQT